MPALPELQRAFGAALVDPGRAAALAPQLRGPVPLERLAVYRGNVYANCGKALAGAYPIVCKIVGTEFFEGLARKYARAHPPPSGDLNEYGARLAEFVAAFPHTQDLPYLPDVARMEWLAHRAYYAADLAPLAPARFAGLPADACAMLRPLLAPACALLASPWPLARIWEVHQAEYAGTIAVDLDSGPDRILVHRPGWRVQVTPLAAGEYRFLAAARDGAALGEALEAALSADPGFDGAAALARWVTASVIVDLAEKGTAT